MLYNKKPARLRSIENRILSRVNPVAFRQIKVCMCRWRMRERRRDGELGRTIRQQNLAASRRYRARQQKAV